MKKLTYSLFIAFVASLLTLVTLYALVPEVPALPGDQEQRTIELSELEQHNHGASCWMAIEGKVYNLTTYIPLHPTRPAVILDWCGTEATEGMRTKGYGRDHSPAAWKMLEQYRIGELTLPKEDKRD